MRFRKQMENLLYHDLKSPMLPIVYLPDILLKNEQLSDSGKSKLTQIKEAAKRIMDLLNEALVAHKFETKGKADTHDVNILQLLRTVNTDLQSLQAEKNLHVILQADSELASPQASVIQGDESLLYRMFANLLKNAIQASPVNSPVSVRLDLDQKRLRITIKNRGEVPQNLRSSFFNKYARGERSQGLGLGTYSAKLAATGPQRRHLPQHAITRKYRNIRLAPGYPGWRSICRSHSGSGFSPPVLAGCSRFSSRIH